MSRARSAAPGRWLRRLGALMIVSGLGVAGWIAWQLWGTTLVSQREQADTKRELTQSWAEGADFAKVDAGRAWAIVRIPRFGDDYAVPILKGVDDRALAGGFGQYADSEAPGAVGNFTLAGHRITHGQPLRDMPSLEVGDEIIIETRTRTYVYELDSGGDDLVVDRSAVWVLDDVPKNPAGGIAPPEAARGRLITLTTCSELFHTDDRMIAFGHLVQQRRR